MRPGSILLKFSYVDLKRSVFLIVIVLLQISLIHCQRTVSPGPRAVERANYQSSLNQAFDLCDRYFLPNTQARSKDVDINEELAKIDAQRRSVTKVFHSAAGIAYLNDRLSEESDDIHKVCMLQILSETRSSAALAIIERYTGAEGAVGERARAYVRAMKGRE